MSAPVKVIAPILVLAGGLAAAVVIVKARPEPIAVLHDGFGQVNVRVEVRRVELVDHAEPVRQRAR